MRTRLALTLIAALAGCSQAPGASNSAAPGAGPALAAGLWQQTVSDAHGPQITRICVDAASGDALAGFAGRLGQGCSERHMDQASDDSWRFSSACDAGPAGHVETHGVIQGDFASHYTIESDISRRGGAAHVSVDVRRLGECPSDMHPGDMILPGNIRARLGDLAGRS